MHAIYLLLYVAGLVCFGLAACGVVPAKVNLVALGLAFWIAVPLIVTARTG